MRKMLILAAALTVGMLSGCGRSDYDDRVNEAIRKAKNPPAAEPENADAGKDAGKEGEAKPAEPMADAPMAQ